LSLIYWCNCRHRVVLIACCMLQKRPVFMLFSLDMNLCTYTAFKEIMRKSIELEGYNTEYLNKRLQSGVINTNNPIRTRPSQPVTPKRAKVNTGNAKTKFLILGTKIMLYPTQLLPVLHTLQADPSYTIARRTAHITHYPTAPNTPHLLLHHLRTQVPITILTPQH
jgi:hypothetical protein